MSQGRNLRVPTPPQGEQIASYATYLEAQRAVDHLSDKEFPVQHVTIVGTDLRMVERITGRLTYSRVAVGGLLSGAWFGLAVGLLLSFFGGTGQVLPILPAVAIGAAFGILFAVITHALSGGQRDFTSASQIVASSYAILCAAERSGEARQLLLADGGPGLGRTLPTRPVEPLGTTPSQAGYGTPAAPQPPAPGHHPGPGEPQAGHPAAEPPTQPPAGPQS